jgi:class 3 adenylate cyclase
VVIIASRIEQLNKEQQSQLLVSEEVINCAGVVDDSAVLVGAVLLKGLEREVVIYKVA